MAYLETYQQAERHGEHHDDPGQEYQNAATRTSLSVGSVVRWEGE